MTVRHLLREVRIGGGHQANIHLDGARAAQPLEFVLLQNPQELGLQLERNIANLVKKQRAAMGQLEAADALRDGAGERALFVTEQLAFQKPRRDGGAVHLYQGALAARAEMMNGAGDQFFSRAGFALNQYRRIGRRDGLELIENFFQRRTVADNLFEVVFAADLILQIELLFAQFVRPFDDLAKREGVFHGDGDLIGDMLQQLGVLLRKYFFR